MQLKEFFLFVPTIESGTVLKALETAIPSSAIEQALGETKATQERKRALPSHLVICLIIAMSLWSKASMRTVLKNLVDGLSEAWVRIGQLGTVPCKSSITEARQRIGAFAIARLFHLVVRPLATVETPGAFQRRTTSNGSFMEHYSMYRIRRQTQGCLDTQAVVLELNRLSQKST